MPRQLSGVAATAGPGLIGGLVVGASFGKGVAHRARPALRGGEPPGSARPDGDPAGVVSPPVQFPFLLLLLSGGHCQCVAVEGGGTLPAARHHARRRGGRGLRQVGQAARPALAGRTGAGAVGEARRGRARSAAPPAARPSGVRLLLERPQDRGGPGRGAPAGGCRRRRPRPTSRPRSSPRWRPCWPTARPTPWRCCREATALVIAGGVAANAAVRTALGAVAAERGLPMVAPPPRFCTDNAVMVAWAGVATAAPRPRDPLDHAPRPRWPLEDMAGAISRAPGGRGSADGAEQPVRVHQHCANEASRATPGPYLWCMARNAVVPMPMNRDPTRPKRRGGALALLLLAPAVAGCEAMERMDYLDRFFEATPRPNPVVAMEPIANPTNYATAAGYGGQPSNGGPASFAPWSPSPARRITRPSRSEAAPPASARGTEPRPNAVPATGPEAEARTRQLVRLNPWVTRFWMGLTPAQQARVERQLNRGNLRLAARQTEPATVWDPMGLSDRVGLSSAEARPPSYRALLRRDGSTLAGKLLTDTGSRSPKPSRRRNEKATLNRSRPDLRLLSERAFCPNLPLDRAGPRRRSRDGKARKCGIR